MGNSRVTSVNGLLAHGRVPGRINRECGAGECCMSDTGTSPTSCWDTVRARYSSYPGVISQSMQSFATLTDQAAPQQATGASPAGAASAGDDDRGVLPAIPSVVRQELIAAINGVNAGETMPAGTMAKRVQ